MQTAVAAPPAVSRPPLIHPCHRPEGLLAAEPRTFAPAGLQIEYVQGAGAGLGQLRRWLDLLTVDPADLEALAGTLRGFRSFAASGATHDFPRVRELGRAGEAACAALVAGRALPEAYRLAGLGVLLDSLEAWFAAAVAIAGRGARGY